MNGKRGAQLARMKAARFFNPLHVLANGAVTEAGIGDLSLFHLAKHPKIRRPEDCEAMMLEMPKFHSIVKTIKPLTQRKDAKGEREGHMLAPWLLARQSQ